MTKRLKRPRDPIALAKLIGDIATGQVLEVQVDKRSEAAASLGQKGGEKRAKKLSPQKRSEIASLAAQARWNKS